MSDTLQPGLQTHQAHPDADQLTAFAEHALPLHEQQQTLAHLATCADCRQIVFLAQEAAEAEVTEPEPVRVRKPWFSGWNLVWPTVLALAGIIAFSVHLRNFAKPGETRDSVITAQVERQSPPVATAPVAPAEPVVENRDLRAAVKKKEVAPPVAEALAAKSEAKAAPPMSAEQQPTNLSLAKAATPGASIHGAMAGAAQGGIGGAAPVTTPMTFGSRNRVQLGIARSGPEAQQVPSSVIAQDQAAMGQRVTAGSAAGFATGSPAPPPPAPQPAPIAAASQTVTVDAFASGAELATVTNASVASLAPTTTLPSHLPAGSTASHGSVTLSLDSQGTLFLSKDQGRHWKRIKASWGGRAATIGVAEPAIAAVFELTTETGAAWTSSDGQHWQRK